MTSPTIRDAANPSRTFTIDRYWQQGQHSDLLLVHAPDDPSRVRVAKSIRYDTSMAPDDVPERRALVHEELRVLRLGLPGLPANAELVLVDHPEWTARDPSLRDQEPVLVYDWSDDLPLPRWRDRRGGDTLPLADVLRFARSVADRLDALHDAGFIYRGLCPDHVLVDPEGLPHFVGLSHAGPREARVSGTRTFGVEPWVAPEIAHERSGRFVTSRADIYSFGLLLAWLVSGDAPTGDPGRPFTRRTVERVRTLPPGFGLLIASCTQPLHKKRPASFARLLPMLHPEHLPTAETPNFGELALLDPWNHDWAEQGRVGHLTAGPLVDRVREAPGEPDTPQAETAPDESAPPEAAPTVALDPAVVERLQTTERRWRAARIGVGVASAIFIILAAWRLWIEVSG